MRFSTLPFAATVAIACTVGCGGGPRTGTTTTPGNTSAVVTVSSTANDQLSAFDLGLTSLTLTSKSGATVNVFSSVPYTGVFDFIHLNGGLEPIANVSIPQDTYTAATATVASAQFTCIALGSNGGLNSSTFAYGQTPGNQVSVALPQPIVVDSSPFNLELNLQATASATYSTCIPNGLDPYSINPTFELTAQPFSNPLDNVVSVAQTTLHGIVSSVSAGSFTLSTPEGLTLTVDAGANTTTYQGIPGLSSLTAGMALEVDAQFAAPPLATAGILTATRLQVLDPTPANLSLNVGPLNFVDSTVPALFAAGVQEQGTLYSGTYALGSQPFSFGNATFQISGYLTNLAKMPFTPSFTAANMVPGQNVAMTSHATTQQGGYPYEGASTITLVPQTINGVVTAITPGAASNDTVYTVSLADYDLFPQLAVQQGQTTLLTSPSTVNVYVVGGSTGIQSVSVGSPYRFTGLVFNDNGTLKMDCLQILAGVSE